jgi:subtilase family serine protease
MVSTLDPWVEAAWSAPVPGPLAGALGIDYMAAGGGFSATVPIPAWQRSALRPFYARTEGAPQVAPYGRGFPDVAMLAWGTPGGAGSEPGACWGVHEEAWRNDIGGTSLSAPLWAAFVALANQARREVGEARLGFANPWLYRLAAEGSGVFREVRDGSNEMVFGVVDAAGRRSEQRIAGYVATAGWNPATGLGVPRVAALCSRARYLKGCAVASNRSLLDAPRGADRIAREDEDGSPAPRSMRLGASHR